MDFEPKTYAEFITYAKANPGKVRYASVGVGSNNHYDTEAFAQWAGIKLSTSRTRAAAARSPTTCCVATFMSVLVNAASSAGWRRRQAQGSGGDGGQRLPEYPDAPTLKELGYANGKGLWSALYAPTKTPHDVLETLHRRRCRRSASAPCRRPSRSR